MAPLAALVAAAAWCGSVHPGVVAAALTPRRSQLRHQEAQPAGDEAPPSSSSCSFLHGVAAGDPLPSGVIIWTRATPADPKPSDEGVSVTWSVWREEEGAAGQPVATGATRALPSSDFTVKIDVSSGLQPLTKYRYQFACGTVQSPSGRFHLPLPQGEHMESLKYAVFSCANYRWGHFTAYGAAARLPLDFWVHLGDFIYESGDNYPTPQEAVRKVVDPPWEAISLEDYRRRYAFYRRDENLQHLSAAAPLLAIWDDHEIANDAYADGAQNHQSSEGPFSSRRAAALQAYHEWLPTRWTPKEHSPPWKNWRAFHFGDLASFLLLETRLGSRTSQKQLTGKMAQERIARLLSDNLSDGPEAWTNTSAVGKGLQALREEVEAHRGESSKQILGPDQLNWVRERATAAATGATKWLLVAQPQVMQEHMSADYSQATRLAGNTQEAAAWTTSLAKAAGTLGTDNASPASNLLKDFRVALAAGKFRISVFYDGWMGYAAERARLLSALVAGAPGQPAGIVIYGGDSHNAWVGKHQMARGSPARTTTVAVEFDGMSVSSPGLERYRPQIPPAMEAAAWRAANPTLLWANTNRRGFMLVDLNTEKQEVRYMAVDTSSNASLASECVGAFQVLQKSPDSLKPMSC